MTGQAGRGRGKRVYKITTTDAVINYAACSGISNERLHTYCKRVSAEPTRSQNCTSLLFCALCFLGFYFPFFPLFILASR